MPRSPAKCANSSRPRRLSGYAAWSLALAGLVGGSVYTVIGLVVALAGPWAWLSFVLAGLVGVASASVYARVAADAGEGGVAFTFLRDLGWPRVAGRISWLLLIGYTLTGGAGRLRVRPAPTAHGRARLRGDAAARRRSRVARKRGSGRRPRGTERLDIMGVWVKVAVLVVDAVVGASVGFVAVEGFQLLSHRFVSQNPIRWFSPCCSAWAAPRCG